MITLPVMKLSRMPMHKLSAVGHHRVGFTSKEEKQRLHEQDTIRGNVRHGTKAIDSQQRMGGCVARAEQSSFRAASASPTAFSGATKTGRESVP